MPALRKTNGMDEWIQCCGRRNETNELSTESIRLTKYRVSGSTRHRPSVPADDRYGCEGLTQWNQPKLEGLATTLLLNSLSLSFCIGHDTNNAPAACSLPSTAAIHKIRSAVQ